MPHDLQDGGPRQDPTLSISLMTATPPDLSPVREEGNEESDEDSLEGLSERQQRRARDLRENVEDNGQFPKPQSGYEPRSLRGWDCSECVFFEGEGEPAAPCELVEGPVRADAVCDLYIEDQS